jgi:hypothetical protein
LPLPGSSSASSVGLRHRRFERPYDEHFYAIHQ